MNSPFPLLVGLIFCMLTTLASFCKGNLFVSKEVYLDLVFYFKYASSAYALLCYHPNGQVLVEAFKNMLTETQGFIARDDSRKEIVIALRGSLSVTDVIIDASVHLTPFDSPGVVAPTGTKVHAGFLNAYVPGDHEDFVNIWNAVATEVIRSVGCQLQAHPGYNLVTTGHSLGGAIASLAAMSLKAKFPSANITTYTYGQPRTGNSIYANWVNTELGGNVLRVVHTFDGVPTMIPTRAFYVLHNQLVTHSDTLANHFYRHHGYFSIEYWQNHDPGSENTTRRCAADGEDPHCSSSIPSTGVNVAHWMYFGILATRPFCIAENEPSSTGNDMIPERIARGDRREED